MMAAIATCGAAYQISKQGLIHLSFKSEFHLSAKNLRDL